MYNFGTCLVLWKSLLPALVHMKWLQPNITTAPDRDKRHLIIVYHMTSRKEKKKKRIKCFTKALQILVHHSAPAHLLAFTFHRGCELIVLHTSRPQNYIGRPALALTACFPRKTSHAHFLRLG